jgi:hypothetical protein
MYKNDVVHPSWLMKRKIFEDPKIKGYREVTYAEDYDFICRVIACGYNVDFKREKLIKCRTRFNGVSKSNYYDQMKISRYVAKMYRALLDGKSDSFSEEEISRIIHTDSPIVKYLKKKKYSSLNKYIFKIFDKNGRSVLFATLKCKLFYGV